EEMRRILETASCSGSLRSDSRPHVTPLVAVWLDDAIHFCTCATEQKAVDLGRNSHVILTTGCNHWDKGIVWRDIWFSSNPNSWKSNSGLLRQLNFGALSDTNFIRAIVRL